MMWLKKMIITLCVAQTASAELTNGLYAAFETTMGSFTCRLDTAEAPLTCANFVGLAEGSQHWVSPEGAVLSDPFYDGLIFHRVMDGFMIQGGDPLGTGAGGPGYAFPDQISTNLLHSKAGILSMANSGPDSNGSQFFITLKNTYWLDGVHAVFGEVLGGMDTIYDIGNVAVTNGSIPLTNIVMNSVQILRIGSEAEAFNPQDEPLPVVSPLGLAVTNGVSGLMLATSFSNQCELSIYTSTTLTNWTNPYRDYWLNASGEWVATISAGLPCEYFKGIRIIHPEAETNHNQIVDHTLTLTSASYSIILQPEAGGGGVCSVNGVSGSITSWSWESEPYSRSSTVLMTISPYNLSINCHYDSATNGAFKGSYYYDSYSFSGTFSDED